MTFIDGGYTLAVTRVVPKAGDGLDDLWLGVLMKNFYRNQLAPLVRPADRGIAPNWPGAFVVCALLGTGIALLIPCASVVRSATR